MDTSEQEYCDVCGVVDDDYEENEVIVHSHSVKHKCNLILKEYKANKRNFSGNRHGLYVVCNAESLPLDDAPVTRIEKCAQHKIRIYAKPNQKVKFSFQVRNDMKDEDILVVGMQLAHPQPQFKMNDHPYMFGGDLLHILGSKSTIDNEVFVAFETSDIGQFEMPIMFTFHRQSNKKNIIFIREMVVFVQENSTEHPFLTNPYTDRYIGQEKLIPSTDNRHFHESYKIPKLLKVLLTNNMKQDQVEKYCSREMKDDLMRMFIPTKAILDERITKENYISFFHHLLWWEETKVKNNIRRYNMEARPIERRVDGTYWLEVPGLAEKRPSVIRGDKVIIRPQDNEKIAFESVIGKIKDNHIHLSKLDEYFARHYSPESRYDIRFITSRVPMERMHEAVSLVFASQQDCRVFPEPVATAVPSERISKFYNSLIESNEEQRSAVEHIVSKCSGKAPYIVFGPPGTGKTMTIVEAIIQIVSKNPTNRVMVCTDSNMAADHVALMLLKYNKKLNISNFILRTSSLSRDWTVMPPELVDFSNGSSEDTFHPVSNARAASYRILVTTLMYAAKYGSTFSQRKHKMQMTHLFIDEAAQAMEPAALVPITGLLAPSGQLVLAGDPKQLGPVCICKGARDAGLGESLLERLWLDYNNLYGGYDPDYITTLVRNFRSHADILQIPNETSYTEKPLQPDDKAQLDPLSTTSILPHLPGGRRAIVFHAVNSREQTMGSAPSYFNQKELEMLQKYTTALIQDHDVSPKDIGIIAPYIRQVYKMKDWLERNGHKEVEIGTVESFQGKEKRVILVSTVRANCRLLDFDAKYNLGFLSEKKRFNVALTRAKAKLVIVGNAACLTRDSKWRRYMELCKEYGSYFGHHSEQLARTAGLLTQASRTRFDRCRLTEALKERQENEEKKK